MSNANRPLNGCGRSAGRRKLPSSLLDQLLDADDLVGDRLLRQEEAMFRELSLIGGVVETAAGCVPRPRRSLFMHRGGIPKVSAYRRSTSAVVQASPYSPQSSATAARSMPPSMICCPRRPHRSVVGFGTEDRNDEESGTGRRARDLGHDLQHFVVGRMKVVEDEEYRRTGRPGGQAPGEARSEALTGHRGRLRLEQVTFRPSAAPGRTAPAPSGARRRTARSR